MRVKDWLWVGVSHTCKKCQHLEYGYCTDGPEGVGKQGDGFETAQEAFEAIFDEIMQWYRDDEDKELDQWEEFIALHPDLKLHLPKRKTK